MLRARLLGGSGRAARLTARLLDKALVMPEKVTTDHTPYPDLERPRRLIVADEATMRRVVEAADRWARPARADRGTSPDGFEASLPFRLRLALGLVASTRVVVLTRALARQYWLPSGLHSDTLASWSTAFGIAPDEQTADVLDHLMQRVRDGSTNNKWARHAFKSESAALSAARFRGLRSAVTVYGRASAADTATRAILTADPLLLERGVLDGSVSRLRVLNLYDESFTASVSLPFRLRPGKLVLLADPTVPDASDWAETTLQAVRVETIGTQDLVTVRIAGATRKSKLSRLIEHVARRPGREMYMTEAPYLPFRTDTQAKRWTQRPATRRANDTAAGTTVREVPLDVLIAGAPDRKYGRQT
ncbi:hypothetical protein [Myceligenerans halotolerans]